MPNSITPVNADPRHPTLTISFGDIIRVTELDGVKTDWRLTVTRGEPGLEPVPSLPTKPGLYQVVPRTTPLTTSRRLMLSTDGKWSWVDFTSGGSMSPAEIASVADFADDLILVYS